MLTALRGPQFSSYPGDDVGWLLEDLSDLALERDTASREAAIQAGAEHYSESLPVEYEPSPAYIEAYETALAANATRVAALVGSLAAQILDAHTEPVIVSLARAGVPVGVLLRRWMRRFAGVDAPHFAISIIRDKGIDERALGLLLEHYDANQLRFVDGWTGKGTIADTLTTAISEFVDENPAAAGLTPGLAVLSDPLHVAELRASDDDLLIPSALLNATVSGLVTRTVYLRDRISAGSLHGAKFLEGMAPADRSRDFLESIESQFIATAQRPDVRVYPEGHAAAVISELQERYSVADRNRLKPGIGETTRVLLRRVPRIVIVRPDRAASLAHVRALAMERGVPIVEDPTLHFACVGVIADIGGSEA